MSEERRETELPPPVGDETVVLGRTLRVMAPGQRVLGRFVLEGVIGRGGMGIVWRAKDETLGETVALKFLPEEVARDEMAVEEMKEEARRARRLTHPNIVRVHDFLQDGAVAAVSMEYVDGETLAQQRLKQPGKVFSAGTLEPLVGQLCEALEYAHTKARIVHRDLKPANILVTKDGQVKVTDFGIARGLAEATTRVSGKAGRTSGTLLYVSPEQMMGEAPSAADDIYALGACLYELMTGKPPFFRGDASSLILQVREKAPSALEERRRELEVKAEPVPREWEETLLACLAKRREDRPQSAGEVVRRLRGEGKVAAVGVRRQPGWQWMAGAAAVIAAGAGWWLWPEAKPAAAQGPALAAEVPVNKPVEKPEAALAPVEVPEAAVRRGAELRVFSVPAEAEVSVNGEVLGKTPATLKNLPTGEALQLAVKAPGYRAIEQTVNLKPGEVRTLNLGTLAAAVAGFEIAVQPAGLPPEELKMLVDGRATRPSKYGDKLRIEDLEPGRHTLEVTHADYVPWKKDFPLEDRELAEVKVNLEPKPATLTLKVSGPPDYTVLLNGKALRPAAASGKAAKKGPAGQYQLPAGKQVTLEVSAKGYAGAKRSLTLPANGRDSWEVTLTKLAVPQPGQPWKVPELGMDLVPISPGTFLMGWAGGAESEKPVTEVTITEAFWLGKTEVTQREWQSLMGNNPSRFKGDDFPVDTVSWKEAVEFCWKLTERERRAGRLPEGYVYALPTEAQWEYACRAGTKGAYSGSLEEMAWYKNNSGAKTHPVATKRANPWGLHDMHGNVAEWTADRYARFLPGGKLVDPQGPEVGTDRACRGGSFTGSESQCRSSSRRALIPDGHNSNFGFRCVIAKGSIPVEQPAKPAASPQGTAKKAKKTASAANGKAAKSASASPENKAPAGDSMPALGKVWVVPDLGLTLVPIAPASFSMGSANGDPDERPVTRVTFTKGFWLGRTEVTQREWQAVMGGNPSKFKGDNLPVEMVSWFEAAEFCRKLTERERAAGRLPPGTVYTLPSEAQWEYGCRAGTTGDFSGDLEAVAWVDKNSARRTHPVATKPANAWGVHDMHGNVWEWCADGFGSYQGGSVADPGAVASGAERILRGGSWYSSAVGCRSANRSKYTPGSRFDHLGFRVALAPEAGNAVSLIGEAGRTSAPNPAQAPSRAKRAAKSGAAAAKAAAAKSVPEAGRPWTIPELGLALMPIAPGTFLMGNERGDQDEKPVTKVTFTKGFWLGKSEVTQREWQAVMGTNPASFKGDSLPIETVSWIEAMEFCRKLTERERGAGRLPAGFVYTLPTEAQWEYACRAGSAGDNTGGPESDLWFVKSSEGETHPVASKPANPWGLHDMRGNVWEWCADGYGDYPGGELTDPKGAATGADRVYRGGSWNNSLGTCNPARRAHRAPSVRNNVIGFRLALTSVE